MPISRNSIGIGIQSVGDRLGELAAWLERRKDFIGVTKDAFTILALAAGGYWTLMLYEMYRENRPNLSIEHHVTHRRLSPDKMLLIIDVSASNTSRILIKPLVGWFGIQQILPINTEQAASLKPGRVDPPWPVLVEPTWFRGLNRHSERKLEPGEAETQHEEVIVDSSLKTVLIYSFFENLSSLKAVKLPEEPTPAGFKAPGWDRRSIYDLKESSAASSAGIRKKTRRR